MEMTRLARAVAAEEDDFPNSPDETWFPKSKDLRRPVGEDGAERKSRLLKYSALRSFIRESLSWVRVGLSVSVVAISVVSNGFDGSNSIFLGSGMGSTL